MGFSVPTDWLEPAADEPDHFEVWPDNWPAVVLFLRCETQWRIGLDGRTGLDYGAVLRMASLYEVEALPHVMEDLQVMEAEVLRLARKS